MASIRKQRSGRWRAQVRRKGHIASETLLRFDDAKAWAVEAEPQIDRGETLRDARVARITTDDPYGEGHPLRYRHGDAAGGDVPGHLGRLRCADLFARYREHESERFHVSIAARLLARVRQPRAAQTAHSVAAISVRFDRSEASSCRA